MTSEPIDEAAVGRLVADHGLEWIYSHESESTNADVLRHYDFCGSEAIAFSESQLAGRGRRGRQWHSPYAQNIYCTIGLIKALPANRQGLLSIVTGLALCRALQQAGAAAVQLKWPNDVLFDGRKLGGILIESRVHDNERFYFAIGFGLNVFMSDADLAAIGQPAASLDQVGALAIDRVELLCLLIDAVLQAIRGFDPAEADQLVAEFARYDAFDGQQVEVISGSDRISGINRGIGASGQLQLETPQGIQQHAAAEISLRGGSE